MARKMEALIPLFRLKKKVSKNYPLNKFLERLEAKGSKLSNLCRSSKSGENSIQRQAIFFAIFEVARKKKLG